MGIRKYFNKTAELRLYELEIYKERALRLEFRETIKQENYTIMERYLFHIITYIITRSPIALLCDHL